MKGKILIGFFVGFIGIGIYGFWQGKNQKLPKEFWTNFELAQVQFDEWDIPTIQAETWEKAIEAQAFVVASERLWQMDLLRRKTSGRLSEWFGEKAFGHDKEKQLEDRLSIAETAAKQLSEKEKVFCNLYAKGVNRYITEQKSHWGVEYFILGQEPEPWSCQDTMLLIMEMSDQLSSSFAIKTTATAWQKYLPDSWSRFLFPRDHRWNRPYFGASSASGHGPQLPEKKDWLPFKNLNAAASSRDYFEPNTAIGSNNWAYKSNAGSFLANDPHLRQSVPGIWYANRIKISQKEWVVGVSVPGIPGVILGMNPHLAWAFTNTGEDVDDLLLETLDAEQKNYLDWDEQGDSYWHPIQKKEFSIKVKGEDQERKIEGLFTRRGPLAQRQYLGEEYYSRQWLALKAESYSLPILPMIQSGSIDEFFTAVDGFRIPSQSILIMDRSGKMAYRASGTGIRRMYKNALPRVQNASEGQWLGYESMDKRPHFILDEKQLPRFLATANERIWVDEHYHNWSAEDRKERIRKVLGKKSHLSKKDMEELQLDTQSEFRKILVSWVLENHFTEGVPAASKYEAWKKWDGSSKSESGLFYGVGIAETSLLNLLLARVQEHFVEEESFAVPYRSRMQRAWILEMFLQNEAFMAFGLSKKDVASHLFKVIDETSIKKHEEENRWASQHPFVDNIPLLGELFKVANPKQSGAIDTVSAEQATVGPSVRFLWDLEHPEESTWIFPIGQSGHVGSPHFKSMQELWKEGKRIKVFPENENWFLSH